MSAHPVPGSDDPAQLDLFGDVPRAAPKAAPLVRCGFCAGDATGYLTHDCAPICWICWKERYVITYIDAK